MIYSFVRIELHGATTEQYKELYRLMERYGDARFTLGEEKYPDACYVGPSSETMNPTLLAETLGKMIKNTIGVKSSILVIKYNEGDMATYHLEDKDK